MLTNFSSPINTIFLRRSSDATSGHDYEAFLPVEIPSANAAARYQIPFSIADDTQNGRIQSVRLRLGVSNLVTADTFEVRLNGESLADERCTRSVIRSRDPYAGQWLDFHLERVRPQKGANVLEVALRERPTGFAGGVTVEDVEILVEYGPYPVGLHD